MDALRITGALALMACTLATPARAVQDDAAGTPPTRPELRAELLDLAERDQEARAPLTTLFRPGEPVDSARFAEAAAEIARVDSLNHARLMEIVAEGGWPSRSEIGGDGIGAVFLLVQHADHDRAMQRDFLAWLEAAYRSGELSAAGGEAVALLTDRLRVGEGLPQLYGTQAEIVDGGIVFAPIEDEDAVDERRASLGLPPLAEYRALLEEAYGLRP